MKVSKLLTIGFPWTAKEVFDSRRKYVKLYAGTWRLQSVAGAAFKRHLSLLRTDAELKKVALSELEFPGTDAARYRFLKDIYDMSILNIKAMLRLRDNVLKYYVKCEDSNALFARRYHKNTQPRAKLRVSSRHIRSRSMLQRTLSTYTSNVACSIRHVRRKRVYKALSDCAAKNINSFLKSMSRKCVRMYGTTRTTMLSSIPVLLKYSFYMISAFSNRVHSQYFSMYRKELSTFIAVRRINVLRVAGSTCILNSKRRPHFIDSHTRRFLNYYTGKRDSLKLHTKLAQGEHKLSDIPSVLSSMESLDTVNTASLKHATKYQAILSSGSATRFLAARLVRFTKHFSRVSRTVMYSMYMRGVRALHGTASINNMRSLYRRTTSRVLRLRRISRINRIKRSWRTVRGKAKPLVNKKKAFKRAATLKDVKRARLTRSFLLRHRWRAFLFFRMRRPHRSVWHKRKRRVLRRLKKLRIHVTTRKYGKRKRTLSSKRRKKRTEKRKHKLKQVKQVAQVEQVEQVGQVAQVEQVEQVGQVAQVAQVGVNSKKRKRGKIPRKYAWQIGNMWINEKISKIERALINHVRGVRKFKPRELRDLLVLYKHTHERAFPKSRFKFHRSRYWKLQNAISKEDNRFIIRRKRKAVQRSRYLRRHYKYSRLNMLRTLPSFISMLLRLFYFTKSRFNDFMGDTAFVSVDPDEYFKSVFKRFVLFWRAVIFFKCFRKTINLPDCLIFFNPDNSISQINDFAGVNLPIISVVDSIMDIYRVTYPIPSNDDSVILLLFYFSLFLNACDVGFTTRYVDFY
jgi:hypothetical protein